MTERVQPSVRDGEGGGGVEALLGSWYMLNTTVLVQGEGPFLFLFDIEKNRGMSTCPRRVLHSFFFSGFLLVSLPFR